MNKAILTILPLCLVATQAWAGNGESFMQSNGKFYVVIAVIVAMFIGVVLFLVNLDKKLSKLENQIKS